MDYFVYIIQSTKSKIFYKGITDNLVRRINQHNSGKNVSTKNKGPFELVYFEKLTSRIEARTREKYFKSGVGREFIKKLIYSPVAQR